MHSETANLHSDIEGLVAELTEAAYGVALRRGFKGTFVEVELGLWNAMRACQGRIEAFASAAEYSGAPCDGVDIVPRR